MKCRTQALDLEAGVSRHSKDSATTITSRSVSRQHWDISRVRGESRLTTTGGEATDSNRLGSGRYKHSGIVKSFAVLLSFAVPFLSPRNLAFAETYFVDPSGSNSDPGTEGEPWLTIQHAADTVVAGDTVIVKAATYEERIRFLSGHSGSPGNKITFKGEPRRSATIEGFFNTRNANYLRIEGFNITNNIGRYTPGFKPGGVWINSGYVEIVDNYFYDIPAYAVESNWDQPWRVGAYVADNRIYHCNAGISAYGDDWLVENNEIERLFRPVSGGTDADYARFFGNNTIFRGNYFHGTIQAEIYPSHTDGWQTFNKHGEYAHNVTIEGNIVEAFGQGVIIQNDAGQTTDISLSDITIRNNLFIKGEFYPDGVWGVLADGVPNITVVHNVFINMNGAGVLYQDGTTGVVKNNIFYNSNANYFVDGQSSIDGGYNILYPGRKNGRPADLVNIDPHLIDPDDFLGADDLPFTADDGFGLQPGSPAIDVGTNVGVTEDIYGNIRPKGAGFDIGAHELNSPFTKQPMDATIREGASHTFTAEFDGSFDPVTFQWLKDGVEIAGATEESVTITLATKSDAGGYTLRVTDQNTFEVFFSRTATLRVRGGMGLPVAGTLGLSLLALSISIGGVFIIHKKEENVQT